ncbi:Hint domain-containing protein [Roseovarius sp. C7]|uniref:Hint domain-containing protein n=1 Tax=Roseovarius sp. C7 TaxID=3398643 RepID=UPI0039F61EB7
MRFSAEDTPVNARISQIVDVAPGSQGSFSLDFGKIGQGAAPARIEVIIEYLDENGDLQFLASQIGSDQQGDSYLDRTPEDLHNTLQFDFNVPQGVTQLKVSIRDATTDTTSTDLYFDNVSLDVTCFVSGTLLETPSGPRLVEKLGVGDTVLTSDGTAEEIQWIGRSRVPARGKLAPIRIAAGALGGGLPRRDLWVSRQHRMVLRSASVEALLGHAEALVPAIKLTGMPGVAVDHSFDHVTYHHLLLRTHEIILAEGAETESLLLGPYAIATMGPEAREELEQIFPRLFEPGTPARYVAEGREAKALVACYAQSASG